MYSVGYIYEHVFSFTQEQVVCFAETTGDINPIHLSDSYALNSFFKKKIIHGFLGGSVFSKVFGTMFPGEGTIYLSQKMEFHRPMFVNTLYISTFTILSIEIEKQQAIVRTVISNPEGKNVISGEAIIRHHNLGIRVVQTNKF